MNRRQYVVPHSFSDIGNGSSVINLLDSLFEEIYLVGGAIRDEILGIETKDLDFATPSQVDDIVLVLQKAGLHVRENGKAYGTIATHIGEYDVQITTYRAEKYYNNSRNPTVTSVPDIDSDLSRRDFTINAMALSRNEFIDPYDGLGDITEQIIRCVGDPSSKLKEDPLRVIRAYRFVSTFGYDIQSETLDAIKQNQSNIFILSSERIAEEFKKIIIGDYWSDALYEMAENGVLTSCLKNFGLTYAITVNNVLTILDRLTQKELTKMNVTQRWRTFFAILIDSERSAGVSTISADAIISSLGLKLLLGKPLIREILESLGNEITTSQKANSTISDITMLRTEYNELQRASDPRSIIVASKLSSAKGKKAFEERHYKEAATCYLEALQSLAENIDFAINHTLDPEKRSTRIESIKRHYIDRYGRYLASCILDGKLQTRYKASEDLIAYLKRSNHDKRLNSKELSEAIDESVVRVYRFSPTVVTLEPYEEFLGSNKRCLSKERITYLLRRFYYEILHDKSLTFKDRGDTFAKIAAMSQKEASQKSPGLEYYDPHIDSLLCYARNTIVIKDFWKCYDKLEQETDQYIEIARQQGRFKPAMKRAYLNAATALVHGLSLATKLEDKHAISRLIVANYAMAGAGYSKNANRFRIYLEWFSFLVWLHKNLKPADHNIKAAGDRIAKMASFEYSDPDEVFFTSELKELANIRNRLKALHTALGVLINDVQNDNNKPLDTGFKELDATITLYRLKLISKGDAFRIIVNHYLKSADGNIQTIPLGAIEVSDATEQKDEDTELIGAGESETVEFKQSWRYSPMAKQVVIGISRGIIKTIAAFMNTRGGRIYIGVHDDGHVIGLEETDFITAHGTTNQQKIDDIKLGIDEMFDKAIGTGKTYLKTIRSKVIDEKTILIIDVTPSEDPVYVKFDKEESFCVRSSASTRELSPSEIVYYITNRHGFSTSEDKSIAKATAIPGKTKID